MRTRSKNAREEENHNRATKEASASMTDGDAEDAEPGVEVCARVVTPPIESRPMPGRYSSSVN